MSNAVVVKPISEMREAPKTIVEENPSWVSLDQLTVWLRSAARDGKLVSGDSPIASVGNETGVKKLHIKLHLLARTEVVVVEFLMINILEQFRTEYPRYWRGQPSSVRMPEDTYRYEKGPVQGYIERYITELFRNDIVEKIAELSQKLSTLEVKVKV